MQNDNLINTISVNRNMCASTEGNIIKIWDVKNGSCINTLITDHTRNIASVQIVDNFIISNAHYDSFKVWDLSTGNCIRTYPNNMYVSSFLSVKDNFMIFTTPDNNGIKKININTGELCFETSFMPSSSPIIQLYVSNNIISVISYANIQIFDFITGQYLRTIDPHIESGKIDAISYLTKITDKYIIVIFHSCEESYIFDINTGCLIHEIPYIYTREHNNVFIKDDKILYKSYYANTIKVWNITEKKYCNEIILSPYKETNMDYCYESDIYIINNLIVCQNLSYEFDNLNGNNFIEIFDITSGKQIKKIDNIFTICQPIITNNMLFICNIDYFAAEIEIPKKKILVMPICSLPYDELQTFHYITDNLLPKHLKNKILDYFGAADNITHGTHTFTH